MALVLFPLPHSTTTVSFFFYGQSRKLSGLVGHHLLIFLLISQKLTISCLRTFAE